MKINLDSQSDDVRIEIVPLIDVIFCILTFFILAALQFTRQQAINVDLPKASTGNAQMRDMLIVRIDPPYGQVYVDDGVNQPEPIIAADQLKEKLQQYRQGKPNGLMVLYASKDVKYNDVVQILDQMRAVGGDRVALATLPEAVNQAPGAGVPFPGTPSYPGVPPATGINPVAPYPYGTQNPGVPFNPNQPQLPTSPGQFPGQPGVNPVPGTGTTIPTIPPPGSVPIQPGTTISPGQTQPGQN